MICYLFPEPAYFLFSSDVPSLLYYAQIPVTVLALMFSFYIFWNNRKFLINRLLFTISILFSLWVLSTLIAWTNIHSDFLMFVWSFFGLILGLIAILCIYFIYVFINKKDISVKIKIIFLLLLTPILILGSTSFNISGFDIANCDAFAFEWLPFRIYYSALGVLAMLWILILLVRRYFTADRDFKNQIILMGLGIELFLVTFFGMEFIGTFLARIGILSSSELELYGLVGMAIFMIYITILIVRFKTFNIKLIASQALVWGLVALIGSQFFFIKTPTNFILNGIGFLASIILGQYLIKSVKREVEQKEQLAKLNIDLQDLLKQRESLVHLVTHKVKGSFTRSKYIFAGILDGTFGDISADVRKYAQQGFDSDVMGIETVDLVLSAANMQRGLVKYEMKPLDLKEIVLRVVEEKSVAIKAKGLTIECNIKDGSYNVLGDAIWLKEAINNLIENSTKYTKVGKIEVSLEKKVDKILFSVKDTGIGITEEDKKNLFTEGGRGKDSVKVNVDSTGYGLYTVKITIEAHKGKVWAESEGQDKGSTFYIELDTAPIDGTPVTSPSTN